MNFKLLLAILSTTIVLQQTPVATSEDLAPTEEIITERTITDEQKSVTDDLLTEGTDELWTKEPITSGTEEWETRSTGEELETNSTDRTDGGRDDVTGTASDNNDLWNITTTFVRVSTTMSTSVVTTPVIDTSKRILILIITPFKIFVVDVFRIQLRGFWVIVCTNSPRSCGRAPRRKFAYRGIGRCLLQSSTNGSSESDIQVDIHNHTSSADGNSVYVDYSVTVGTTQLSRQSMEQVMTDEKNIQIFQNETKVKFTIVPRDKPDDKVKEAGVSIVLIVLLTLLAIFILVILLILVIVIAKKRSENSSADFQVRYQPSPDSDVSVHAADSRGSGRTQEYVGDRFAQQAFDNKGYNSSRVEVSGGGSYN